jgi:thiol-disulfide isomerase/thioredoxin|tara:strand:- start:14 stop:475 length:462 start_codon:yes stop_codon:yes gene_type:complete
MFIVASAIFAQEPKKKYPDIDFVLFNGKKISMDELVSNGPIVMQFWAIWCAPCKKEMYYLDKIQEKYKSQGVSVICVNTDNLKSMPKAKAYIRQKRYGLLIAEDPSSHIFNMLNANVMPTTIVFDSEGQIVYRKEGYMFGDEKKVEAILKSIL